jgi:hypothetical protein
MTNLVILAVVGVMLVGLLSFLKERFGGEDGGGDDEKEKAKYAYTRKQFFMNRAEHEFYDVLVSAIGGSVSCFCASAFTDCSEASLRSAEGTVPPII